MNAGVADAGGGIDAGFKDAILPLYQSGGWMKFLAVLMFLQGFALAVSVVGLVICWLPVWVGVLLWQSANRGGSAYVERSTVALSQSLSKLKLMFTVYAVLKIIVVTATLVFMFMCMGIGLVVIAGITLSPRGFEQFLQTFLHPHLLKFCSSLPDSLSLRN